MKKVIFVLATVFCFFSCDSGDQLWGLDQESATPTGINEIDKWASFYFNLKEAVCLDNLDNFSEVNTGWMDCGFLVQRGDSLFTVKQSQKIKFSLSQGDLSFNGGASSRSSFSSVTFVNRFGYEESLMLKKCNVEENYFYIFSQKSEAIAISAAFSVVFPLSAKDLGREFGLLSTDRIIGVVYEEGQTVAPTLLEALGNTGYANYLLRQNGCPNDAGGLNPTTHGHSQAMDCRNVVANGRLLSISWVGLDRTYCGVKQSTMGIYDDNIDIIARVGEHQWQVGYPIHVAMYSKDSVLIHEYDGFGQGFALETGEVKIYLAK